MTTIEKNKELVEFLGYKNITPTDKDFDIYEWLGKPLIELRGMKYHSDYNWIMEVVNRIEQIGYQVDFGSRLLPDASAKDHWCTIWNDSHTHKVCEASSDTSKIDAVHEACVEFAVWFKKLGMPLLEIKTADRLAPFSKANGEGTRIDNPRYDSTI